jgi:hypothetical protein
MSSSASRREAMPALDRKRFSRTRPSRSVLLMKAFWGVKGLYSGDVPPLAVRFLSDFGPSDRLISFLSSSRFPAVRGLDPMSRRGLSPRFGNELLPDSSGDFEYDPGPFLAPRGGGPSVLAVRGLPGASLLSGRGFGANFLLPGAADPGPFLAPREGGPSALPVRGFPDAAPLSEAGFGANFPPPGVADPDRFAAER